MSHEEHSGHMGHDMPGGEMPMPMSKCSVRPLGCEGVKQDADHQMNMLWNSQVADTCVVFESWHISGWITMSISWYVPPLFTVAAGVSRYMGIRQAITDTAAF